jgi:PAS domain S-box-containing protein
MLAVESVAEDPETRDEGTSRTDLEQAVEQLRAAEDELRVQNEELRTHRAATEGALHRYQELFDLAPDPYLTTDASGIISEANTAAARLLNVPIEKLKGQRIISFVAPGRRRAFRAGLSRIAAGDDPAPGAEEWAVQFKPRRGALVDVSVTAAGMHHDGPRVSNVRWLLRDVTARRRAEAEVRTLNAELEKRVQERTAALEAANWAKAEFLSVMAHELRTPLNAIIGYTELLEMGISGPVTETQRVYLDRIRSSGQRLVGLVGEVLDLGKVEAGQLRVVREECSIADAIEGALGVVLPLAASRAIRVANLCDPEEPIHYIGDQSRVEQILINLLTNGVKFTEQGGRVEISCSISDTAEVARREFDASRQWVALRVRDDGIGMTPEEVIRVFEPFVQVERPLTRTRGGTGLGLTISRRLARLMGGDLTVDSHPGKGSTFTLWLPAMEIANATPEELERRAPARYAQGIARLGTALLEEVDGIVRAYARRLKAKRGIAKARKLNKSELEDHAAAFLADIVQALVAVEEAQGGPSGVMRDGSVLRRIISERHGAQRQRLGWTEDELRMEFRILKKCVDDAARKTRGDEKDVQARAALQAARTVLSRLLDTAEEISLRGYRLSGMAELQNTSSGS